MNAQEEAFERSAEHRVAMLTHDMQSAAFALGDMEKTGEPALYTPDVEITCMITAIALTQLAERIHAQRVRVPVREAAE